LLLNRIFITKTNTMEDLNKNSFMEIGALSHIVASLIAGTTNKHFVIDSIESSSILSSNTKSLIMNLIKKELARSNKSDSQSEFPADPSMNEGHLSESKEKIKSEFKRFL